MKGGFVVRNRSAHRIVSTVARGGSMTWRFSAGLMEYNKTMDIWVDTQPK